LNGWQSKRKRIASMLSPVELLETWCVLKNVSETFSMKSLLWFTTCFCEVFCDRGVRIGCGGNEVFSRFDIKLCCKYDVGPGSFFWLVCIWGMDLMRKICIFIAVMKLWLVLLPLALWGQCTKHISKYRKAAFIILATDSGDIARNLIPLLQGQNVSFVISNSQHHSHYKNSTITFADRTSAETTLFDQLVLAQAPSLLVLSGNQLWVGELLIWPRTMLIFSCWRVVRSLNKWNKSFEKHVVQQFVLTKNSTGWIMLI